MHRFLIRGGLAVVIVGIVGIVGIVASSRGVQPATAAEPDPATAPIERYVDRAMPDGASGTLVAMRGHRVVSCRGFGLVDRRAAARDCDTVYDMGSVTKQFTAAAVVKLQMLGRLDVHEPIGGARTGSAGQGGDHGPAALTHTAGLVEALGDDYERLTRRQAVTRAMASDAAVPARTAYHYSNVGYSLLAVIVERASGTGYERFLARRLFRPAGMTSTGYVLPDWRGPTSPSSTTPGASRRDARSTTRGRRAGRGGTCAATEACSRPRATWCAGTGR